MKERETAKIEIDRVERDIASLDFPFAYVAKKHFLFYRLVFFLYWTNVVASVTRKNCQIYIKVA